jgi:hypothetical protein
MQMKHCRYTLMKNISINKKGLILYKPPVNLSNIYQFAADKVTPNTTVKSNTCSVYNKCEKLWILVSNQSATVMYVPVRHWKVSSTTPHFYESCLKTNRALRRRGSTRQPQTSVYCVVPVTPSADPQRSSLDINIIEPP